MRQAGVLAAAGSYALDHHVDRLRDDHALASHLASGLQAISGLVVEQPHSNIVFVDLVGAARERASGLLPYLKSHDVLTSHAESSGLYRLRFVTHLDVDRAGIDRAVGLMRKFFAGTTH